MKKSEILGAVQALTALSKRALPIKLSYGIAKNLDAAKQEQKLIQEGIVPKIDNYEEFRKERTKCLEEAANKDDNGKPRILPGHNGRQVYDIAQPRVDEIDALLEESFPGMHGAIDEHNKKVDEFLEEETLVKWHLMKFEWFGELQIPARELEPILELFSDTP